MAVFATLEKTYFNNRVSFCNSIKSSQILMMPCITYVKTEIWTQIFHKNFSYQPLTKTPSNHQLLWTQISFPTLHCKRIHPCKTITYTKKQLKYC